MGNTDFFDYFIMLTVALMGIHFLYKVVIWSKKMTKGAVVFLAIFPIISIFPIPQQEIKKIENIKKVHVKKQDENGEPIDDDEQDKNKNK